MELHVTMPHFYRYRQSSPNSYIYIISEYLSSVVVSRVGTANLRRRLNGYAQAEAVLAQFGYLQHMLLDRNILSMRCKAHAIF
jgi:hypothetical protein